MSQEQCSHSAHGLVLIPEQSAPAVSWIMFVHRSGPKTKDFQVILRKMFCYLCRALKKLESKQ